MTPAFQIIANGKDATARMQDRLLSIEIFDEDGKEADRVEITLDDRDGRLELPDMDARLEVWLGWPDTGLQLMGVFAVDGLSGGAMPQTLTISATAADLKSEIRAPRTRAWENRSFSEIVGTIAGEAGLRPVVAASLGAHRWPYLAQTAESDLHFLTRLAATLDATVKPAGGALIAQRRGEGQTAAGDPMPRATISRSGLTAWDWRIEGREKAGAVEAEWADPATGQRKTEIVGSGKPKRRLRRIHADAAEAREAAAAELKAGGRGEITLNADTAGFWPSMVAGGQLGISGLRSELDGDWHLSRVTHRLDSGGLLTGFEAKRKGE